MAFACLNFFSTLFLPINTSKYLFSSNHFSSGEDIMNQIESNQIVGELTRPRE